MADANPNEMVAEDSADVTNEAPSVDKSAKRKKLFLILGAIVLVAAILWGVWYFLTQAGRVHTDNAYVGADTAQVTPLVAGAVKEVRVGGTQVVHKGDILVVIDDADAKVDVATARAALFAAQQKFGQASAMSEPPARKCRRVVPTSRRRAPRLPMPLHNSNAPVSISRDAKP
jgi:membrane fusion protein (multidrug efflux system)